MEINVNLLSSTPNSTLSWMTIFGSSFSCFVIEDAIRPQKIKHETCIPGGRYQVVRKIDSRFLVGENGYKTKYGLNFVPHLIDVPNFENILIHIGNSIKDTSGCLLTNYGSNYDPIKKIWTGQNSTVAFLDFMKMLSAAYERNEEVFININRK